MKEIAEQTFTSKPTLVRFVKKLAFLGWKEFREAFLDEISKKDMSILKNMKEIDDYGEFSRFPVFNKK